MSAAIAPRIPPPKPPRRGTSPNPSNLLQPPTVNETNSNNGGSSSGSITANPARRASAEPSKISNLSTEIEKPGPVNNQTGEPEEDAPRVARESFFNASSTLSMFLSRRSDTAQSVSSVRSSSSSSSEARSSTSPTRFNLSTAITAIRGRSQAYSPRISQEKNILIQGILSKRKQNGVFHACEFIVTSEEVKYYKLPLAGGSQDVSEDRNYRTVPLETIVISETREEDMPQSMKRERTFRFNSKLKSFVLKAKTIDVKEQWVQVLSTAAA